MSSDRMAESGGKTTNKYSCACGLSQDVRKRPFTGKCRHCHTRPKYLTGQSSFDSGSASRGSSSGLSPVTTPSSNPPSGRSLPSSSASSSQVTPTTGESTEISENAAAFREVSSSRGLRELEDASSNLPTISSGIAQSSSLSSAHSASSLTETGGGASSASDQRTDDESHLLTALTRRRSRSVDRYEIQQLLEDPPPYDYLSGNWVRGANTERRRRSGGVRRTGSEDRAFRRISRQSTPPPSYEAAQNPDPPTYEEAVASNVLGCSTALGLSALIAATPDLRSSLSTTSGFLVGQTSLLSTETSLFATPCENHRGIHRSYHRDSDRHNRRTVQRQVEREAQIERERERDRELEEERLRELQVAQYCGCSKCRSLYYSYCYDDVMNSGSAFPLETQVIMQEVLADGLAFCSLM